jgi:hypothetical protein
MTSILENPEQGRKYFFLSPFRDNDGDDDGDDD